MPAISFSDNLLPKTSSVAAFQPATGTLSGLGPGTLISTTDGDLPIEFLVPGDRVLTRSHGALPLRWIGRHRISARQMAINPSLHPRIMRSSLPEQPLVVAAQHRLYVDGPELEYYFGHNAALAPADCMTQDLAEFDDTKEFSFFHLLFDTHQVIRANGLWVESMLCNDPPALNAAAQLPHKQPPARHGCTVLHCLTVWEARFLLQMRSDTNAAPMPRAA